MDFLNQVAEEYEGNCEMDIWIFIISHYHNIIVESACHDW